MENVEYIKLFWSHNLDDEPVVIFYEVDLKNERLAKKSIDVFIDRKIKKIEDLYKDVIEIVSIPTVEELNSGVWGEEFFAYNVTQTEFEYVWDSGFYQGELNVAEHIGQSNVVDRIRRMEQSFNIVSRTLEVNPKLICEDAAIQKMVQELTEYMDGGQWLQDYECDERGELPADLKRGVLSEDGLYNLLCEIEHRKSKLEEEKMNIAVFASHGGSDLQAIIDGCKNNQINAKVAVVISNNGSSMALERAYNEKIPAFHLSAKKFGSEEILAEEILNVLAEYEIDMIFLAGYMRMLHVSILEKYDNRIFNIHPALLPKFGGKGMYGMNVHTAVIEAKEKETGVTIHRVSAEYDSGEIVAQTKVPVLEGDTPEVLAARVLEKEHEFLVEVISDIVDGKIMLGR